MARSKRKRVTMIVTVSVPIEMTAWEARREVRTNISDHSGYASRWEEDDVKPIRVSPVSKRSRP